MAEYELLLAEEELIADAQVFLHDLMQERGLKQAELAKVLGTSRAAVSQLFSPDAPNLTLRKLARVAAVLGARVSVGKQEVIDSNYLPGLEKKSGSGSWSVEGNSAFMARKGVSHLANDNNMAELAHSPSNAKLHEEIKISAGQAFKYRLVA